MPPIDLKSPPPVMSQKKKSGPGTELIAGAIAGLTDAALTHPIDTIKTRLQLQTKSNHRYNSAFHAFTTIGREEGWRALYKGFGPVCTGIMPKIAIRFTSFEQFKLLLSDENGKMTWQRNLLAGLGAGVVESILIVTPIELVKIRLQAQGAGASKYKGQLHAIRTIIKEEGITALYKGLVPTTLRQSFQAGMKFCAYNEIKDWMLKDDPAKKELTGPKALLAGALANSIGAILNTPIDVVKTRIQKQAKQRTATTATTTASTSTVTHAATQHYTGIIDCFRRVLVEEGPKALFKGVGPRVARLAPSGAIQFAVYEQALRILQMIFDP